MHVPVHQNGFLTRTHIGITPNQGVPGEDIPAEHSVEQFAGVVHGGGELAGEGDELRGEEEAGMGPIGEDDEGVYTLER